MLTVPNSAYHPGRQTPIRVVVLHTAECPCEPGRAESVAEFLARPAVRASAHYVVDPDATVAQVAEADTAWAAPGANADGIQIEQCAYAKFTSSDWSTGAPERMLRTQTVPLLVDICQRNSIPPVWLSAADLLLGRRGITDHATVNKAYEESDHWDCGASYPGQQVAARVSALMAGQVIDPEANHEQEQGYEMRAYKTKQGNVVLVDGGTFRVVPSTRPWEQTNAGLGELVSAGLIPAADQSLSTIGDNAIQMLREVAW